MRKSTYYTKNSRSNIKFQEFSRNFPGLQYSRSFPGEWEPCCRDMQTRWQLPVCKCCLPHRTMNRVTTHPENMENLEKSGNSKLVRENGRPGKVRVTL